MIDRFLGSIRAQCRTAWACKARACASVLVVAWAMHLSVLVCHARNITETPEKIPIESGWEFQQSNADAQQWLPAMVPGDVHLDLLRNHLIPDPYHRDNEAERQWIGDASWTYRTTITIAAKLLERPHVDLVFDGLDTSAEVFLNGTHLLTADNMFRQWPVDAKAYLHSESRSRLLD